MPQQINKIETRKFSFKAIFKIGSQILPVKYFKFKMKFQVNFFKNFFFLNVKLAQLFFFWMLCFLS